MLSYLESLTVRLAQAMAELPESVRARHAAFVAAAQRPDGGFAGRQGDSDLYYTSFAARSLAMLGELTGPLASRLASFLSSQLGGDRPLIDRLSLIYAALLLDSAAGLDVLADSGAAWRDQAAESLAELRRDDGGFAKTREGAAGSTYYSFLALSCLQLIQRPLPEPQRLVEFIDSQRRPEGGFRETRVNQRAGTNPTAAAVGVLRSLDALDEETRQATIRFLAQMQNEEGGLRANTRIPIADLLSTFTGVLTLIDLGGLSEIDASAAWRYANSLQQPLGGFHGAVWDQECDLEYTFYGLGCLGLLPVAA